MTKADRRKASFQLQYKMVMHPKGITHADLCEAAQLIRDLESAVDIMERNDITHREELRKLLMENNFLNEELAKHYEGE